VKRLTSYAIPTFLLASLVMLPNLVRAEELATYEDWTSAATIRSDRWVASSDLGHERLREVHGGKLVMRYRREGGRSSDFGSTGFFSNRLNLRNPLRVEAMDFELKVRDLEVTGCLLNPTASIARAAAIDLTRISDLPPGTLSAPGDLTGDYIARVEVRRLSDSSDPAEVLSVRALLFRCDNPGCAANTLVGVPVILGQVLTDDVFRIRLRWNPSNDEFLAGLGDAPDVSIAYPPGRNARPANSPFALLRIQHLPANCTAASGGPTVTDAEVEVGTVRTNVSAVIP
jgi:hypothetical protein